MWFSKCPGFAGLPFLVLACGEDASHHRRISKCKFWQESNHAIVPDPFRPVIIDQKLNYMQYNPVEEGIVQYPEEYLFSSARDYEEIKGLVKVEII